jgi:hypothetical protein
MLLLNLADYFNCCCPGDIVTLNMHNAWFNQWRTNYATGVPVLLSKPSC